jgi:DNA-binding protein HU-alpha
MNKTELVDAIAAKADMSKAQAKVALEQILETITQSLKEGDPVQLVGFGTFRKLPLLLLTCQRLSRARL